MGQKAVNCLLHYLAILFTGLLLAAAVVSWRSSYISPEAGRFWASLALLMPVILVFNAVMLVWWLFRRSWGVALMPVAALALNLGYISAMVQLPDFGGSEPHDIRVATLNVYGFRRLGPPEITAYGVATVMKREKVDVLCLQEFPDVREFPADSIARLFVRQMPYFVSHTGQAILSRFPILDHRYVRFPESGNDYLQADLLVGIDTVRVFSVHLQTSGISSLRRRFRKDYDRNAPVERVIGELERNSRIRAKQVREIRAVIDSTHYPVILAGDFNDTPSSFTYRRLKGGMTDGFREVGDGFGGTFRYLGGVLRIDYVLYDDHFAGVDYYMPADDLSDHKAVIAGLKFRR